MMVRAALTFLFITFFVSISSACEICGCSNNELQIGVLPNFKKGFIGYRYSLLQFSSHLNNDHHHSDEISDHHKYSKDYYQNFEIWGGYNFKKVQLMAFAPYILNRKSTNNGIVSSQGIGDILLLANYKVWSNISLCKNEKTTFKNELYVGGGAKLPTGNTDMDPNSSDFNIGDFNSQPGTGSLDFILTTTYNLLWNNSGIVTNLIYRINTTNHMDYKFGNRSYLNSAFFHTFNVKNFKIKPNLGINYQGNSLNTYKGNDVKDSNGYILSAITGLTIFHNNIGFNSSYFIPVSQNIYHHKTELNRKVMVGITYSF